MFNRKQTIVQIQQQAKSKWETLLEFSTRIPTVAYHNLTTEAVEATKRSEYGMLRAVGYEEGNSEELQKFHLGDESCLIAFAIAGYEPTGGLFQGVVTTFTAEYQIVDLKKWDNTEALVNILRES